jgi:tartrate dehydratase alpha subunit/fumarate hydratase class I-like protein
MMKKLEFETIKASYNLRPDRVKKLRKIAAQEELTQTEIMDKIISEYIDKWEKKNGPITLKGE